MISYAVTHELSSVVVAEGVLEPISQDNFNLHKEQINNSSVDFLVERSTLLLKDYVEKHHPHANIKFIKKDLVSRKDKFSLKVCLLACSDNKADLNASMLTKLKNVLHEFSYQASNQEQSLLVSSKDSQLTPEESELTQRHADRLSESSQSKRISRPFIMNFKSADGTEVEIPFDKEFKQHVTEGGEESESTVIFAYTDGSHGVDGKVFLRPVCEESGVPSDNSLTYKVDYEHLTRKASLIYATNDYPLIKATVYTKKIKNKRPELRVSAIEIATPEEIPSTTTQFETLI